MAEQEAPAGQRARCAARRRAPQHALVLRRGVVCRAGHQAHAELRQDQVQANLHRPPPQLHHFGKLIASSFFRCRQKNNFILFKKLFKGYFNFFNKVFASHFRSLKSEFLLQ